MLIFAYGSLVGDAGGDPDALTVDGISRSWGVAMDNRVDLPAYKAYFARGTGERFDGFVAFLDVAFHEGASVDGVVIDVADANIAALDARERNYERTEISALVDLDEPLFTYVGSLDGRRRLENGRDETSVAISAAYLESARSALSEPELAALPFPALDLERVDL